MLTYKRSMHQDSGPSVAHANNSNNQILLIICGGGKLNKSNFLNSQQKHIRNEYSKEPSQ